MELWFLKKKKLSIWEGISTKHMLSFSTSQLTLWWNVSLFRGFLRPRARRITKFPIVHLAGMKLRNGLAKSVPRPINRWRKDILVELICLGCLTCQGKRPRERVTNVSQANDWSRNYLGSQTETKSHLGESGRAWVSRWTHPRDICPLGNSTQRKCGQAPRMNMSAPRKATHDLRMGSYKARWIREIIGIQVESRETSLGLQRGTNTLRR